MKKNKTVKDYVWNTLGSGLASVTSLLYMIIATRINGTSISGIFSLCFSTSCIIYAIALYSGRIYQVTENNQSITDNDYVAHRLICSIIAIIFSLAFGIINKYTGTKITVLLILSIAKIIEAINDVFHGILQKNNHLDTVGKSLLVRSLLNIISFLLVDLLTHNIVLSCLSLIIDDLLTLCLIDIKNSKHLCNPILRIEKTKLNTIFKLGFFTFTIQFISNFLYNIPRYALDNVTSNEMQAIYGIIIMPATIIMVINQFIIHPIILKLKNCFHNQDKSEFSKTIIIIIILTISVGIISEVFCYFLGIPILEIIYGVDLSKYLNCILIIIAGATLYTISSVLSNALIVLRKTKMQFYTYFGVTCIAYFISKYLVQKYLFNGAVYAYLIMMLTLLVAYILIYIIIINKKTVWKEVKINERKN